MRIPKGGESIDQRQSKAQAKFAIEPWLDGMVRYDTAHVETDLIPNNNLFTIVVEWEIHRVSLFSKIDDFGGKLPTRSSLF